MNAHTATCCARTPCPLRVAVGRALAIIAIAGLIGPTHSIVSPIQLELRPNAPGPSGSGRALPRPADPTITAPPTPTPDPSTQPPGALGLHITLAQARALYDSGEADFIDAREPFEYEPSHIPGAYNLTQADFASGKVPVALEVLDPARPVVIYCGGGTCQASENVAILLQQSGFASIHIMTDGFPTWVQAGYETDSGPDPLKEGTP